MAEQIDSMVPQIRFKGFEGDWDEKTLGDEPGEIVAGGDIDKKIIRDKGKYPVLANALTNDGIVGYYDDEFRVKAPAVTVTGRGDVGHAKARKTNFTPVVRLLSVKTFHDVHFLECAINLLTVRVESTGVPQLTVPQFKQYKITFPKITDEETQIGGYFREVDRLIGLHQRKHDKLVTLKKAMLQKMLPQPGATIPEIRFKGFSGDWMEIQLGNVCLIRTGKKDADEGAADGLYPFFTCAENHIYSHSFSFDTEAILIAGNANVGQTKYYQGKFEAYQRTYVLTDFSDINTRYLYTILDAKLQESLQMQVQVSAMSYIKLPMLNEFSLAVPPTIEEQQKIGTYFRTLDELISKHATQLQKLQQIKSACLEKMFV